MIKKIPSVLMLACLVAISNGAWAKAEYSPAATCGAVKVVSGDTCSNVKVEFDFSGCLLKSNPQIAKKIICVGNKITARFQEGPYRYEADFDKVNDEWAGTTWKANGEIRQFQQKQSAGKAVVAPPVAAAPVPAAAAQVAAPERKVSSTEATAASPFKFGAYFDIRFNNYKTENNLTANGRAESGFAIEEGAFYLNYEKDRVSFVGDIAIRRAKDVDIKDATPPIPNQSNNANLALGFDRSQLYVRYKLIDGLVFDLGQYDTIYGVELNDSKDRVFGKTGLVYDATLPVTHTGLKLEYLVNGVYLKALAANPNNKGSFGTSTTKDENTEYGAAVGFGTDSYRGQLGYLARPIGKADGLEMGSRTLIDVILGTTLGGFSLDLEYTMVSDPSKNSLTSADTTDLEKAGTGAMALASYKFNDNFTLGLRLEAIDNDPLVGGIVKKVDSYGVAAHYRLASELQLRAELVDYKNQNLAGTKWNDSRFNLAALTTF